MKQSHPFNLTVNQVAEHFGLSPRTIRDRIKSGDLAAVQVGGEWRCRWPDLWAVEKGPMPWGNRALELTAPLLTKKQLGELWGKSERTVERWIAEGLPTRNVFGSVRIAPADADLWMQRTFSIPLTSRRTEKET